MARARRTSPGRATTRCAGSAPIASISTSCTSPIRRRRSRRRSARSNELVRAGKVREIGCSNFSAEMIEESARISADNGWARFVSVQNEYSLLRRGPEKQGVLDACAKHDVAFIPYFPLASGVLSGKYQRGAAPPAGTRLAGMPADRQEQALSDAVMNRVEALDAWAREQGHTLLELAFAWLLARPVVASVIAGATKPEQVIANAAAGGLMLTDADMAEIDAVIAGAKEQVTMELEALSRAQLAVLGREWLLHGHLQDRVGMPLVHTGRTREEMEAIAIEEWMAASPIYSLRTQKALELRRRRRADDPQEHPARHRCPAPLHGLPVQGRRREPRRVLARALRRAARRRTDGRGLRARHVPRDRRPHVRRDGRSRRTRAPRCAPFTGRRAFPRAANRTVTGRSRSIPTSRRSRRIPTVGSSRSRRSQRSPPKFRSRTAARSSPAVGTTTPHDFDPDFELEDLSHRALVTVLQEVAVQSHLLLRGFAVAVAERYGEEAALGAGAADLHRARGDDRAAVGARARAERTRRARHRASPALAPDVLAAHVRRPARRGRRRRPRALRARAVPGARRGRRVHLVRAAGRRGRPRPRRDRAGRQPRAACQPVATRGDERFAYEAIIDPAAAPAKEAPEIALAKISGGATFVFTPRRPVRVG